MLVKALLVGLVLGFCKSEWMYGFLMTGRPIVVSTLTGLVLGDPVQGVILGSILELMFIGAFNVGVALYPDYTSAGAICTAFAILTGGGKAVATALAVPIGLLGAFIFVGIKIMINTSFFSCFIIYFIYAFVCIYVGSGAVEAAVNAIPKVVINGLTTSANLLPAIGFAMLLQMIISKKMAPFFFIGFILAAYLNMPTIAVTLLAVMIVLILVSSQNDSIVAEEVMGGDENEF